MFAAVILAAGASSRMGGPIPKQLLQFRGQSLIRHAVQVATDVPTEQIVVVVGHAADRVMREIADMGVSVVLNEQWEEGVSTSLRGGLAAISSDARGVFVYPADMPLVTAEMLRELARRQQSSGHPAAVSEVGGVRGVPVYITRSLFPPLMILDGDIGGAQYLRAHPELVEAVNFEDSALVADVDLPSDLQHLLEQEPGFDPFEDELPGLVG